jgi:hypothetical protein
MEVSGKDLLYRAKPVRNGQIRTLMLQAGQDPDPIKCTLKVDSLKDKPLFRALSYTWGPPDETREISLDNVAVPVRENLWQALLHLRYPSTDRTLWVDAVCIDQNNDKERSVQVQQMYNVYATAEDVLVWLGREPVEGLGFPTVDTEFKEAPAWVSINPSEDWSGFTAHVDNIMQLYNKEYWSRIWIIQEILFARRIIIHFGPSQISWHELTARWDNSREDENMCIAAGTSLAVMKNRNYDPINPVKQSLSTWLHHFNKSQCYDPRDKVYAFLGLIAPSSRRLIKVNYEKKPEDLTDLDVSDFFWDVRRAEQIAHPREKRFLLDYNFSRSLGLQYLLRPRVWDSLTSRSLELPFMQIYERSGPTEIENAQRLLGFGMDGDEDEILEGMYTHYRHGGM